MLAIASAAAEDLPAPRSFAELESAGARVGQIHILPQEIFDTSDPKEGRLPYRWANALHVRTRPFVIERALLFKSGDPVSVRLIEETERTLRSNRYLYDVQIRPGAYHDGSVDIEVITRDTWSLDPSANAGRTGGANSSGIHLAEHNLLGTGISLGVGRSKTVDRTSQEFKFSNDRVFGTRISTAFTHETNSDGSRDSASIVRPFYALDARWAAGVTALRDDRIDPIYNAGNVVSEFRHRLERSEAFAGWSAGLSDGWVQRYSVGLSAQKDVYAPEPGRTGPPRLPADEKLVAPFVRYELLEDHYETLLNHDLIGRPEFFALGFAAKVQLGWAGRSLGSTQDMALYAASVGQGFQPTPDHTLTLTGELTGRYHDGAVDRQQAGFDARWYARQSTRWLFYAAASADVLTRPGPVDFLLLGGDNGLRGYPLRYQSGTRRALFTVEERWYTDAYPLRLFRVGGAAFIDVGRAWGGDNTNALNPGWLSNVGVGLRVVNARSAFSSVLHVDVAFPIQPTADLKKVQLLVKTRASF